MPTGETTSAPVLNHVTSLINAVGDDLFSTIDLTTLVDPTTSAAPTTHYGPYASGSSDSGTCGNYRADDTYDRHFTVFTNKVDGSILVVEQFKDGNFLTPSTEPPSTNQSPGACNTSLGPVGNGGTVATGIQGSFHGYFVIPLPTGTTQTSDDSSCVAGSPGSPCTTTGFINTHFSPACYPLTCTVTTFFFHYAAGDQSLIMHEWQNTSPDRGGNTGDIRSA